MAQEKEDIIKKAIKEAQEEAREAATAQQEPADAKGAFEEAEGDDAAEKETPQAGEAVTEEEDADEAAAQPTDAKSERAAAKDAKKKEKADRKTDKDKTKERIEELEDKVKRQLAEFENFRTRSEREKGQMYDMGARSVLEKILPVVDNFERGLMAVPADESAKGFVDGMNMIYKQLMTELENMGVKPIEAVGCEFNPKFHNAVMQVESEEYESGTVAQELQKGYMYRDTVIRHSMVAVVQ